MSNELKKGQLFLQEVTSRLAGNTDAAVAAKITRKAISAFESQIAGLKAALVDAQDELEAKQDSLKEAIYPNEVFTDNKRYCQSIVNATEAVEAAQEKCDNLEASLALFQKLLAEVD